MAYYHTYRPQNFADISDTQNKVAEGLVSSLLNQNVNHAYLFTGSHGIGKTSCARILSKALNCERYSELKFDKKTAVNETVIQELVVPCNICSHCISITNGSAVDVVEMDAASNRGIDDIRDLRERVRLLPAVLSKKVYIIDEVHMLTTEAFNALLKTLEEPPKHCLFILCTTDREKVPATIQSRCTSLLFQRPTVDTISIYLKKIVESEKLQIDEKGIRFLARLSKGAFRDAAKYLEQAALLPPPITSEKLEAQFVGGESDSVEKLLSAISSRDVPVALQVVQRCEQLHVHFAELIRELIDVLQTCVLFKSGVIKKDELPVFGSFNVETFCTASELGFLSECIESLMKALGQQKTTPIAALPLELACIRLLSTTVTPVAVTNVSRPVQSVSEQNVVKKPVVTVESLSIVEPTREKVQITLNIVETQNLGSVSARSVKQIVEEMSVPVVMPHEPLVIADASVTLETLQNRWGEVIRLMKKYSASMSSLMVKCKPVRLEGKVVTLETSSIFHKDILESAKSRPVIEQAIYELLGAQVRVKGALTNTKLTSKQIENVQPVSNDDLVAAVQEIFGT